MSVGQLAINLNTASPGLFFKDSAGALIKVGPVHVGTTAPNASPAGGGETGNTVGEQWLDTAGGTYVFKVWDGSAWRSESGTFVDVNGDVMTGALGIIAGSAGSPGLYFSGDTNTGLYSPGADQVAISTNGTGRLFVDASGHIGLTASASAWGDSANGSRAIQIGGSSWYNYRTSIVNFGHGYYYDASDNYRYVYTGVPVSFSQQTAGEHRWFGASSGTAGNSFTPQERMRLDSSGRLGLGTSSPGAPLNVRFDNAGTTTIALFENQRSVGGSPDAAQIVVGARGYNHTLIRQNSDQGAQAIGSTLDTVIANTFGSSLHLATGSPANIARLTVTSAGLVGIGTTTVTGYQSNIVHLHGSTGAELHITTGGTGTAQSDGLSLYVRDSDGSAGLMMRENNALTFGTNDNERARIDSSGRLLVGTSTARANFFNAPASAGIQLEAAGNPSAINRRLSVVYGDTDGLGPYIILGTHRSASVGGITAVASGDELGGVTFQGSDGTEFVEGARIQAFVDGTPGANDMPGRLVFSTCPDGASSPVEGLRIDNQRCALLCGVTASKPSLDVCSNRGIVAGEFLYRGSHSATPGSGSPGTVVFTVGTNGDVKNTNNSYGAISDAKLKENIVDANSQWDDLKALQVRNYNFKEGQTHTQIGLIAQEVELVSPGLVTESPDRDAEGNDLGTTTKSVNYSVLYMKAVKALQEAMERIETLEAKVAALEGV
jgi:hypothetical protein